jgi:DNA-binding XRE family transcriptional regulator
MDIYEIIDDLESSARLAGFKMPAVCKEAGVAPTTYTRWKKRKVEPKLSTANKLTAALERLKRRQARETQADAESAALIEP